MRWIRVAPVMGLAAAIALIAVPSLNTESLSAQPAPAVVSHDRPVAHASDDDAPLPYPSIVNVRIVRAEAALERAVTAADQGQELAAIPEIVAARDNMVKAWTAAKYVIAQTPPVDPEAEVPEAEDGGAFAEPADTAAAVLSLQHDIITTGLSLMDVAGPDLALTLRGTISGTMTVRDTAIEYIHTITPPVAEEGSLQSAAPVGGTFDVVMPLFISQLQDETLQANGSPMSVSSPANFGAWIAFRVFGTSNLINTYWPPVVGD